MQAIPQRDRLLYGSILPPPAPLLALDVNMRGRIAREPPIPIVMPVEYRCVKYANNNCVGAYTPAFGYVPDLNYANQETEIRTLKKYPDSVISCTTVETMTSIGGVHLPQRKHTSEAPWLASRHGGNKQRRTKPPGCACFLQT